MGDGTAQWSGIRRNVMEKIVKRLDNRTDVHHLRAVCTSWRFLVPLPSKSSIPAAMSPNLPFPISADVSLSNREVRGHFTLRESTIYCVQPITKISNPNSSWIVCVEETGSGKARLVHPISSFPVDSSSERLPRVLNLLDYRVTELNKSYALEFNPAGKSETHLKSMKIRKVAVSSIDERNFAVIVIYNGGRLGLWRTGVKKWTVINDVRHGFEFHYEDIAHHNGKFYAVDFRGVTIIVDPSSLKVTRGVTLPLRDAGTSGKKLVDSFGGLFLVQKFVEYDPRTEPDLKFTTGLGVYKLDADSREWVMKEDVQARAFFIGERCCFCVPANLFPGCKRDSVYFTDARFGEREKDCIEWDVGLYDVKEDTVQRLLDSDPCYSNIFWPPPPWLIKRTKMNKSKPQWSGLRRDVMGEITKRLTNRIDILHVRAVCNSWRSSVPFPPKSSIPKMPLKLPFPICPYHALNRKRRGHFILKERTIYCIEPLNKISNAWGTTKSWFACIEEEAETGKASMGHPLSSFPANNLSKPKILNLLEHRVFEVTRSYRLEFIPVGNNPPIVLNEMKCVNMKKVVVSIENEGEFAVMAIHTGGRLGLWRMGDKKWTVVDDFRDTFHFEDVSYHNGRFYAVDLKGMTIAVDPSSSKVIQVVPPAPYCGGYNKLLVESLGDLYMVDKFMEDDPFEETDDYPVSLFVYKLNESRREWVQVNDLGERSFFTGDHCCFSVSARVFVGCKNNSIYFTDTCFGDCGDERADWDVGLFDLEEGLARALTADPCYSKIFWPPPSWLVKPAR